MINHLTSELASAVMCNIFYGFYLNLFITSTYLFSRRFTGDKADPYYRSIIFLSTFCLFAAITTTNIFLTVRMFQAFILSDVGPVAFFAEGNQPTSVAFNVFSLASIFFNDFVMIYRLYIVWGRTKLVMIMPILAWIGFTICAVFIVVDARTSPDIALVTSMTPSFVFTLATNLYCTVFIAGKIYVITRHSLTPVGGTNLRDILAMIVESSALSWALVYAITHQINNEVQFIALSTLPPMSGIANALLQTRIGMGKSVDVSTQHSQTIRFRSNTNGGSYDDVVLDLGVNSSAPVIICDVADWDAFQSQMSTIDMTITIFVAQIMRGV
ncbi:hypothetical protein B0H12DRAFT_1243803 [Mycena haematopus]|nr:hypothetical protein B0H12DRAFT_1243803 [Mycena haematopus]